MRNHRLRPPVEVVGTCPACGARVTFETWLPYGKEGAVKMNLNCECGEWFRIETPGLPFEEPIKTEEFGW